MEDLKRLSISHWEAADSEQLLMIGWQVSWLLWFPGNKPVLDRSYLITHIGNVLVCALSFVRVYNSDSSVQVHNSNTPSVGKKTVELHPFRMQARVSVAYWPAYQ